MKKKYIIGVVVVLLITAIVFLSTINNVKEKTKVTFNIIKEDITTNDNNIEKSYHVKEEDIIKLNDKEEYKNCGNYVNDIKIIKITDDYIKISRNKNISNNNTEEVIENINYDKELNLYLYENKDSSSIEPECSQARYRYYGIFRK